MSDRWSFYSLGWLRAKLDALTASTAASLASLTTTVSGKANLSSGTLAWSERPRLPVTTISAANSPFTYNPATHGLLVVQLGAGNVTVNLPHISSYPGVVVVAKVSQIGVGTALTLVDQDSLPVDGNVLGISISTLNSYVTLVADSTGSAWWRVA